MTDLRSSGRGDFRGENVEEFYTIVLARHVQPNFRGFRKENWGLPQHKFFFLGGGDFRGREKNGYLHNMKFSWVGDEIQREGEIEDFHSINFNSEEGRKRGIFTHNIWGVFKIQVLPNFFPPSEICSPNFYVKIPQFLPPS